MDNSFDWTNSDTPKNGFTTSILTFSSNTKLVKITQTFKDKDTKVKVNNDNSGFYIEEDKYHIGIALNCCNSTHNRVLKEPSQYICWCLLSMALIIKVK